MIEALTTGELIADPQERTTRAGKPFWSATLRVPAGEDSILIGLTTFSETAGASPRASYCPCIRRVSAARRSGVTTTRPTTPDRRAARRRMAIRGGSMRDAMTIDTARPGLLALDLGTRSGWAMRNNLGTVAHGFIDLKGGRFEGGGMRFLRFGRWLDQLHEANPVAEVAFEEVRRHLGVDAAHVYGGLMATLTAWCEQNAIPYSGIPVGAIKKSVTGSGSAGKAKVIEAVRARGFEVTDDNAADAIALLLTVESRP